MGILNRIGRKDFPGACALEKEVRELKLYLARSSAGEQSRFLVYDHLGALRHRVDGKITAGGGVLCLVTPEGRQEARIRQKNMLAFSYYSALCADDSRVRLLQSVVQNRPVFYLRGVNWFFHGDATPHSFAVMDVDKSTVMTLQKTWTAFGDGWELFIAEPADELRCLCIAVCVENALFLEGGAAVALS